MVVREMGAHHVGLVRNVTIPKQTAAGIGYWLTESQAITESQRTFGHLALTPRTVGALTQVSRLLMLQSSPSVHALVMSHLVKLLTALVRLLVALRKSRRPKRSRRIRK